MSSRKEQDYNRVQNLGRAHENSGYSTQREVARNIGVREVGIEKGTPAANAQAHVGNLSSSDHLANFQAKGMGPK